MNFPLNSFLKVQLLAAHLHDQPLTKEEKGWLKDHINEAVEFMEHYGFLKRDQKKLVSAVGDMIKGASYEDVVEPFHDLGKAIKDKLVKIHKDTSVRASDLKLLRDIALVNRNGSEAAWNRVHKAVGDLRDPHLNARFTVETEDPDKYKSAVKKAVKKLTGKEGIVLTAEEAKKFRESKPDQYKEYLKARKELGNVAKNAHLAYVRASGKHLIPVEDARKHLDKGGFVHNIPKGFDGLIDENGKLYTKYGEKILGIPGADVKMNPRYVKGSTEYVFKARPGFGETDQMYYTANAKAQAVRSKGEKVEKLSENIGNIRNKWLKDLDGHDQTKKIMAAMLETIFQTSARVGNKSSQKAGIKSKEPRFGLTTLKSKHVRISPSGASFSYLGKSSQKQKHVLPGDNPTNKKVLKIMSNLKEEKSPNQDFWLAGKKRINSGMLNRYFQSLGSPATVHKLRHMRGNQILNEELKNKPKTKDETKINDFLFKSLTKVGKQLGHFNKGKVTPSTALSAYVTPGIVEKYYKSYGVRPPARVQRVLDVANGEQGTPKHYEEQHEVALTSKAKEKVNIRPAKLNKVQVRPAHLGPVPKWFERKDAKGQREYIRNNPGTKLKPTKF